MVEFLSIRLKLKDIINVSLLADITLIKSARHPTWKHVVFVIFFFVLYFLSTTSLNCVYQLSNHLVSQLKYMWSKIWLSKLFMRIQRLIFWGRLVIKILADTRSDKENHTIHLYSEKDLRIFVDYKCPLEVKKSHTAQEATVIDEDVITKIDVTHFPNLRPVNAFETPQSIQNLGTNK